MKKILVLKNLRIILNKKQIINFQGQTIRINQGDKVALLGKNGAGKTTLINAIIGKIPYLGEIYKNFDNNDIGIVFQNNEYSDLMKVKELIDLVFRSNHNEVITLNKFCQEYNLTGLLNKYIKDISVGEKQRLTIGLVLSQTKKIYFLDELTSGLDYEKREFLENDVKTKIGDATVIQITHYFEEIENWANKIIIIDQGRLLFQGSIREIFKKYPHYSCIEVMKINKKVYHSLLENWPDIQIYNNRIFTKDKNQNTDLINFFSESSVSCQVKRENIYTTYLLVVGKANDTKSNSKFKNAI